MTNNLHGGHDLLDFLVVQLKDAVQYTDLIVTERFLALPVEGQERAKLRFLIRVGLVSSKNVIEELGDGPCNRCLGGIYQGQLQSEEHEND